MASELSMHAATPFNFYWTEGDLVAEYSDRLSPSLNGAAASILDLYYWVLECLSWDKGFG